MGSSLPSEKLDMSNYSSWEYKMTQHLVGQGYWNYINIAQENRPESKNADYSTSGESSNVLHGNMCP